AKHGGRKQGENCPVDHWRGSTQPPSLHKGRLFRFIAPSILDKPSIAMLIWLMLSKELVAASTVPLVLSVLADGESYGYALIQQVRDLSGGKIEWTEWMLYPV